MGLSQAEAADVAQVTREHWGRCERGLAVPGGEMLAHFANKGADVLYILTGRGDPPEPRPSADEQELLALFRAAPLAVKAAAIGALQGGGAAAQVAGSHNIVAGRDMTIHQAARASPKGGR